MLKVAGGGISGSLNYQGTWNASTNTPTLASGVGTKGYYYVVSTAGTTNLDGITDWQIGDWAVFNGTIWQKVDNSDAVVSVNGQTGAVVLTAPDVGATPNTAYVLTTGLLSGGGQLTGNVTVDLTSVPIANVPGGVANTTTITAGTGLNGGGNLASNVTINLANTSVTAGTYGSNTQVAQITIDAQGRVTSASNVAITGGGGGSGGNVVTAIATITSGTEIGWSNNSAAILSWENNSSQIIAWANAQYAVSANNATILINHPSAPFGVVLPTAASITGQQYKIKKIDSSANAVTVSTTSSQTIDNALTYPLSTQYQSVTLQSDGSNWWITAKVT